MLQKASEVLDEKGKPRNTEQSQKSMDSWWHNIQKHRFHDAEIADKYGKTEYRKLICLELDGGNCTRCHKPWRKIEFSNPIGKGIYYRPNCDCFYRCPNCDSELFDEMERGILQATNHHCPKCKWPLVVDKHRNWGKEIEEKIQAMRSRPWELWQWKKELGIVREIK